MENLNEFMGLNNEQQQKVRDFKMITNLEDDLTCIKYVQVCDFNLERAIENWFSHGLSFLDQQNNERNYQDMHQQIYQEQFDENIYENDYISENRQLLSDNNQPINQHRPNDHDENDLHSQYKRYLRDQEQAQVENYNLLVMIGKSIQGVVGSISDFLSYFIPNFIKTLNSKEQDSDVFIKHLRKKKLNFQINFLTGDFIKLSEQAQKEKKPLLIFFNVENNIFSEVIKLVSESSKISAYINQNYVCYGLMNSSNEAEVLKEKVNSQNWPCLSVFRRNIVDKDMVIENIVIVIMVSQKLTNEQLDETYYYDRLVGAINDFYMILTEEEQIKKRVIRENNQEQVRNTQQNMRANLQNMNARDFQRQVEQNVQRVQQQQFNRDRQLREDQERQFQQVQQQVQEQIRKKSQEEQEKMEKERQRQLDIEKSEQIKRELQRIKEQKKDFFKDEPVKGAAGVITIQFRLPSGDKKTRRFDNSMAIRLMFDFIEVQDDIEFENSLNPKFDLVQPHAQLSLKDNQDNVIQSVFGDSRQEILYVKEEEE